MTASVKTSVRQIISKTTPIMEKPTIKTPIKRPKLTRESEIGACWCKSPANGGDEYMTGDITINGVKTSIVLFRNNFKDTESKPDWRIYKREPLSSGVDLDKSDNYTYTNPVDQNPALLS